ncbi:MAG: serine/threonine-protein phosphatase [Oscillospiraceae bacterium]|nr:serine/threonine-protein phosphatase [Oscillospiraceae bacterium]
MDHTNFAVYSAAGNRQINEDCARAEQHGDVSCFVLCDGLGGHGRGEVASGMAVETILSELKDAPSADAEYLAAAMEAAQARLLQEQEALHAESEMKTTAVVLMTDARSAVWAHIGDSRLYLFYKNKIVLRTLDHSVPQMLVLMGEIKEKQIRQHPDRNRLLRVLGCEWGTQRYACSEPRSLEKCQAFLLCSDGFWEFITEKMMCKYLKKSKTAAEWLRMMQEEVQRNGIGADMDNNTAVAVRL